MQLSHPSEFAHPGGTAPHCAGVVLWDFDQYARYQRNTLITFFTNLLKRLEADGVVRSILEVHTIAFGLSRSFDVPGVTSALTNMCVEMRLVSDAKREETDRQLERAARELASDPAVEAIVILSSDKDFNGLVRDLRRQANKRVYVVHDAPRGSPHEELLSLYATGTYRIDDFVSSPQRSNFGATGTVRQGAPPSYAASQHQDSQPRTRAPASAMGGAAVASMRERRSSRLGAPLPPSAVDADHLDEQTNAARRTVRDADHLDEQPIATRRNVRGGAPAIARNAPSNVKSTPRVASSSQRSPPAAAHGHSGAAFGSTVPLSRDAATASRTISPRAAEILRLREIFP